MRISLIPPVLSFVSAAYIGLAGAQMPPPGMRPPIDVAAVVGIDADRAAQVEAILRDSHEKMRAAMEAIRAQTDQQLATVLTADELARLHEATRPRRPRPPASS